VGWARLIALTCGKKEPREEREGGVQEAVLDGDDGGTADEIVEAAEEKLTGAAQRRDDCAPSNGLLNSAFKYRRGGGCANSGRGVSGVAMRASTSEVERERTFQTPPKTTRWL
jgi:hypothetical protein